MWRQLKEDQFLKKQLMNYLSLILNQSYKEMIQAYVTKTKVMEEVILTNLNENKFFNR
jgi:hypothetical protein